MTRAEHWHRIEGKFLGRCLLQAWNAQRTTLVEILEHAKGFPGAVVLAKTFTGRVPQNSSRWPELIGCTAYAEIAPNDGTWVGLERALEALGNTAARGKTYRVTPDLYYGGQENEYFACARTPKEALALIGTRLEAEGASFQQVDDGKIGDDVWTVAELPGDAAEGVSRVIEWDTLHITFFKASR